MNAVDFPRRFAAAFVAQDVPALVGFVANGGTALTLTGAFNSRLFKIARTRN